MVRLFICILLLGICAAQYQLWLGRASWSRLSELRVILNTQREENESLRRTNEALQAEFNSLANNQDAIEERARRELNMVLSLIHISANGTVALNLQGNCPVKLQRACSEKRCGGHFAREAAGRNGKVLIDDGLFKGCLLYTSLQGDALCSSADMKSATAVRSFSLPVPA